MGSEPTIADVMAALRRSDLSYPRITIFADGSGHLVIHWSTSMSPWSRQRDPCEPRNR